MRHGIVADLCNVFDYGLFINAFKRTAWFFDSVSKPLLGLFKILSVRRGECNGWRDVPTTAFLILPKL